MVLLVIHPPSQMAGIQFSVYMVKTPFKALSDGIVKSYKVERKRRIVEDSSLFTA